MLCRWILLHRRVHGKPVSINSLNFCTQRAAIENILRTELSKLLTQSFECILKIKSLFLHSEGFTNEAASKLLNRNDFLLEIKPEHMKKSFERLKKLNFEMSDIKIHPSILLQDESELLNNFQRLQEVGFKEVTAYRLANVRNIMSNSVEFNESFNFLPKNLNIVQSIFTVANIPVEMVHETKYDRDIALKAVHQLALRRYMIQQLGYKSSDIDAMWSQHSNLKARSLQSIVETARILEKIYGMPVRDLSKYMLTMQPGDIEELLAAETELALESDIDIRKVMALGPKCNLTRIKEIQKICSPYKIPNYVTRFSPKIFYINFDTLTTRLNQLSKLKRADEFFQHVTIGRVILNLGRIQTQMKFMKMDFDTAFSDTFVE